MGSVFSIVMSTFFAGTTVPSATALIETGSRPPCALRMYSQPSRLNAPGLGVNAPSGPGPPKWIAYSSAACGEKTWVGKWR